jgi:hypothetical protein
MKSFFELTGLMVLLSLSACGAAGSGSLTETAAAETAARPNGMELEFVVEGQVKSVPAKLYLGEGYSMYIPDAGWRLEQEREDGIPEDTWESTVDDEVQVSVFHYRGIPAPEAVTVFLEEHDDFVFRELLLDYSEAEEPLEGVEKGGEVLKFILRSGMGDTYIVSWEYRDALGIAASQAEQMVKTFALT